MLHQALLLLILGLAACATVAPAPVTPAPPAPVPVARGLILRDQVIREVQAADVPDCTRILEAELASAEQAARHVSDLLDGELAATEARIATATEAREHFAEQHGLLRSVGLEDQLALYRQRLAAYPKPRKADRDELARLEGLAVEWQRLADELAAAEAGRNIVLERKAELMLAPRAQIIEPCRVGARRTQSP